MDAAFDAVERLPAKYNFEVNVQVYTCLMAACASNGDMHRALELLGKVEKPDAKTFSTLINGCLKQNLILEATKLLDNAVAARCALDRELVEGVIFMAMRRRLTEEVEPVMQRLKASGFALSERVAASIPSPQREQGSRLQARRKASQSWRDSVPA